MTKGYEYNKRYRQSHPEVRQAENRERNHKSWATADNARLPWSQADDRRILSADRPSDSVLVLELRRSYQAIQHRRWRLVTLQGKTCEERTNP
jgi:hypothetical protein